MFRQFARPLAALPFLLLQACSGGGGDASSCDAVGGNPNAGVVHGTYDNLEAVADSSLGTFAELFADTGSAFINTTGKQFAGGANAGSNGRAFVATKAACAAVLGSAAVVVQ